VVYHGTNRGHFTVFQKNMKKFNLEEKQAGVFFTNSLKNARMYAAHIYRI
jgi:hypothetical protein